MRLSDTFRSIIRRWYIVFVGVLLSAGAGWTAFQVFPPVYEASASVLLVPSDATVGEAGNPYLYLGGMTDAVDVLIRRSSAEEVTESVLKGFEGAEYVIGRDHTTDSPIATIKATAQDPRDAMELMGLAITSVRDNLGLMQDDLDVESQFRLGMRNLVVDAEASTQNKTAVQLALVAVAGGLVASFMVTGYLDGVLTRRSRRRTRTADDSPPAEEFRGPDAQPRPASPVSGDHPRSVVDSNDAEPPSSPGGGRAASPDGPDSLPPTRRSILASARR